VYRGVGGLQQVELAETIRNRRRSSAIRPVLIMARAGLARFDRPPQQKRDAFADLQ